MQITLQHPPHANYRSRGQKTLTDILTGSLNGRDGRWLGFEGTDFNAELDLRSVKKVHSIKLNFLHDQSAWIFAPGKVNFSISTDGKRYIPVLQEEFNAVTKADKSTIKTYEAVLREKSARFIRIEAKNAGPIPAWHSGAGGKAWIFVDEIIVIAN